ncbi:MAG TPA: AI-2E family transporter [Verrucomicrobiales bacterium]|nr:AI-2E family transporter [Verrucomicrobiales bacterium]
MSNEPPSTFQRRTLWTAATGVGLVVIGAIAAGLIWLSAQVLSFLQPVLVPLAIAGIIAYLLEPIIRWLQNRGLPRKRAFLSVYLAFNLGVVLLALSVIPTLIGEAGELYASRVQIQEQAGRYFNKTIRSLENRYPLTHSLTRRFFRDSGPPAPKEDAPAPEPGEPGPAGAPVPPAGDAAAPADPVDAAAEPAPSSADASGPDPAYHLNWEAITAWFSERYMLLLSRAWEFIGSRIGGVFVFFGYLLGLFLVPIYLYYFLKESAVIAENWQHYLPLRASRFKDEVVGVLKEINGYLIAFFRGQMVVSIIDGILISICLALIGMPYSILIGVFVAVLGLIPYIGNLLCLIPAVLISIAHFSVRDNQLFGIQQIWIYPLIVVAIFFVTQQINSLFTAPRIVGDSVGLHPFTVIFSVLFWSLLIGGFLGALLAVPLTASIKVLFKRYIWERSIQPGPGGDPEKQEA